jgi:hypothetical protein
MFSVSSLLMMLGVILIPALVIISLERLLATHGLQIPAVTLTDRIGVPTFFPCKIPAKVLKP